MKFPDQAYTNQANDISENAIADSVPIYNNLVEHFKALTLPSESFGEVQRVLQREAASAEFLNKFSRQMYDGLHTEDALGRSFTIEKDRYFSKLANKRPSTFSHSTIAADYLDFFWITCKDDRVSISLDLTPESALKFFREKAFWISGIENDRLLKAVQASLDDALASGKTWDEWKAEANQLFDQFRVEPLTPAQLHTVYRTNLFSAYSSAQLDQIQQMPDRFPLWRYVAILDSVTRPSHAALNDKIFRVGEGPYPPIDYNCRCSGQHIHKYEVDYPAKDGSGKLNQLEPSTNVQLPPTVLDFTDQSGFQAYLARKQATMDARIKSAVTSAISDIVPTPN
jgi:SPP1 gp7 family putative phage head morphogenesis protein